MLGMKKVFMPSSNMLRTFSAATKPVGSWLPQLSGSLESIDSEVFGIVQRETQRQSESITLIPSENFTSKAVLEALGSIMQNKYSEGYPGARYYGGNEFIDQAESLCMQRALETYKLDPNEWGVNVQPLSGSPANFYCYTAMLSPHDRIMSLDLPHGGHLSHGYQTPTKKISAVSTYFEVLPFRLNESTGLIDYDDLEALSLRFRPKMLVTGASSYSRLFDFQRLRSIADGIGAIFLYDMAHVSGLVAAGVVPTPFEHADIVTTTTHKSLRGPRGAMIFYRKGEGLDYERRINQAVFPGHQGGPHNHTITALAVALKQAQSREFKEYQERVLSNCQKLAKALVARGYELVSGGTDNHLVLINLRNKGVDGGKVERVLEACNIAANKNTVPGDKSAMVPGGLRIGTPAVTTRGMTEEDMETIAGLLDQCVEIAVKVQEKSPSKKMKDFRATFDPNSEEVLAIKKQVIDLAKRFAPE